MRISVITTGWFAAGGPGPQGYQGGRLAGAGEPVAAVAPVTADCQQAKGPVQVARFVDGPADVMFVRQLPGPASQDPLFGARLPHGRLDLGTGYRVRGQEQGEQQFAGEHGEVVAARQAGGDGTPQAAGTVEKATAPGGQREHAARPAGQAQILGEVAQLVQRGKRGGSRGGRES